MSKKSLKRRIKDLEDQNELLNEDLDSMYTELEALKDDFSRIWSVIPKINTDHVADNITDVWAFVNNAAKQSMGFANTIKNLYNTPRPKINDEG